MSQRGFARHGQAPYVGQQKTRLPRPTPAKFQPLALLAVIGAICLAAGYFDGLVPW